MKLTRLLFNGISKYIEPRVNHYAQFRPSSLTIQQLVDFGGRVSDRPVTRTWPFRPCPVPGPGLSSTGLSFTILKNENRPDYKKREKKKNNEKLKNQA
uniref:Uncharacterized protein n=1 Tax=Romanomermis culicivorax TaxID=13658 RepID=A0A915HY82_ROMCU